MLVEEGSLKNQLIRLRRYVAAKNEMSVDNDWIVAREYVEEGKSAKNTNRPKYQQMLRDIEDGTINTVLFSEISRLSRSVFDFLSFGVFLKRYGASFICIANDQINTATPMGNILFVLITALMEFEREINVERSKNAYVEKAKRGLWTGGMLLGYDLDPEHKGHLKVNTAEKMIVRYIFRTYIETGSAYEVANRCRQRQYSSKAFVSRRGKTHQGRPLCYSSVVQILRNTAYIGLKEVHKKQRGKSQVVDGNGNTSKCETVKTSCWEPIVDEDIFSTVQGMLDESEVTHTRAGGKTEQTTGYLLSQLLVCGSCREPLTNGGTKKDGGMIRHYVHRLGSRQRTPLCQETCELPPNVNADRLDEVVWGRVSSTLDLAELRRLAAEMPQPKVGSQIEALRNDLVECERRIRENEECRSITLAAFGKPVMNAKMQSILGQLVKDNADLAKQIEASRERLAVLERGPVSSSRKTSLRADGGWSVSQKRQILQTILRRVVLVKNSVVIEPYQGDPIVGELLERQGVRSGRWRYMDVKWLN